MNTENRAEPLYLSVIMERRAIDNRWASHQWQARAVLPGGADEAGAGPDKLFDDGRVAQWRFPALPLRFFSDETNNYLVNLTAAEPRIFVMWREEEVGGQADGETLAVPRLITVSLGEAASLMDAGEQVDGVPMPADIAACIEAFCGVHYRPEEKKKKRFADPRARDEQRKIWQG